ncbi:helix-turn-helix transcriptional regulator [Nocardioides sp. KIGAM211]|uniref:Helix-turn-helix transcriptional regulator n=1 Tax=Nocardioides luti TaxID=2761101 RepID=A0A7X0RIF0_9ACTN|nr:helix-turn-helix transcriptional regulator [Nocardioides luti]MBB6628908.1 helix-turn-helix transcriptional regulator [Nocardioides luti]
MVARLTIPTRLVLAALLEDPDTARYGLEIGEVAGLPSGTVHPILARLEGSGWVVSQWEDVDPAAAGRPARRYYRLTDEGRARAAARLAAADAARRRPRLGLAPGALGGTS